MYFILCNFLYSLKKKKLLWHDTELRVAFIPFCATAYELNDSWNFRRNFRI